jgi:8-oxo-dGTP pyrophosphatase MutT (NUDIX family)
VRLVLDLRQHIVGDGRVSTGLIAWHEGRLVWAIGQRKYWRTEASGLRIPVVGIGGGQEAGETLPEAVVRETREEASVTPTLRSAVQTLWIWPDEDRTQVVDLSSELAGETVPALIWQRPRLDYIGSDGVTRQLVYINAVYEADLPKAPRPAGEIVGLLALTPAATHAQLVQPRTVRELVADGAVYTGAALSPDARLILQGSAAEVARYWLA